MMTRGPKLPRSLQIEMIWLRKDPPVLQVDNGGQYMPGQVTRIPFKGAVLPMSEDDLRRAPQGTYTANARKLYTDESIPLRPGAEIEVAATGERYTVRGEMGYGTIHSLSRYIIERKEVAG